MDYDVCKRCVTFEKFEKFDFFDFVVVGLVRDELRVLSKTFEGILYFMSNLT